MDRNWPEMSQSIHRKSVSIPRPMPPVKSEFAAHPTDDIGRLFRCPARGELDAPVIQLSLEAVLMVHVVTSSDSPLVHSQLMVSHDQLEWILMSNNG